MLFGNPASSPGLQDIKYFYPQFVEDCINWCSGPDTKGPVFIILIRLWTLQAYFRVLN